MAKVTEGDPYYYAPTPANEVDKYVVYTQDHHNRICETVGKEYASLIVDALNFTHAMSKAKWKSIDKDNMEFEVHTTCYIKGYVRCLHT